MLTTQPVDEQHTRAFLDYWYLVGAPLFFLGQGLDFSVFF